MEYFWKQNKSYVIAVGAIAAGAILWHMLLIAPTRRAAEALRLERDAAESALAAAITAGQAGDDMIARAERDLERSEELVASLSADMAAPEKPPFSPPEG